MARDYYAGPYSLSEYPDGRLPRQNDGAVTVMGVDADGDHVPVLHVLMSLRPKRSEAWRTEDAAQEAFARRIVDLLNKEID